MPFSAWTSSPRRIGKPFPARAACSASMSQPFHVAESFTGMPGKFVHIEDTIKGFEAILGGDCDNIPEQNFLMAGSIEDVYAKGR